MNKKDNRFLFNILAALAVICVMVAGLLWYKSRSKSDVYAEIQESTAAEQEEPPVEKAVEEVTAVTAEAAEAATTAAPAAPAEEIPIDFKTL